VVALAPDACGRTFATAEERAMKNPLLVPELREMLASERTDEIREFCAVTPPDIAAEFLGALTRDEQHTILKLLEPEARSLVFGHFDEDSKLPLLEVLPDDEAVEILAKMPDEARLDFLERVPDVQQARLREVLQRAPIEDAKPVLDTLDDVLITEAAPPVEELTAEEIAAEVRQHLEAFRMVRGKVEPAPRIERGCWVNVIEPDKDNLPLIAAHFKIPTDFLTAALDLDETARIESEDNATLFILKVPYFDERNTDVLYFTIPIGIILVDGLIITICPKKNSVLHDFIDNKVRNIAGGHRFILQLILRATLLYLRYLKQLNHAANIVQKKLEQESRNKQLIKLFNIEKSLVYFTTSLKSNILMLDRVKRLRALQLDDQNESLLEDIFTECKQAIEMAGIYSDILSGMMDAFASVISNNLNLVMRMLTSLTIIITIPVLVASFYGMNVPLPFAKEPWAFLFVIGLSAVLCTIAITYFLRKRWLDR
jgi:magnesium transporter